MNSSDSDYCIIIPPSVQPPQFVTLIYGTFTAFTTDADRSTIAVMTLPMYASVDTHVPTVELSTLQTVVESSGSELAAVAESIALSDNEAQSTSDTVSRPPSTVSLQTGEANTLRWSAFFGVVSLLNLLFIYRGRVLFSLFL
ncbi:Hypothetical protein PAS_chr1-4_0581 [Komagataella phaffii GS115]|uniref:Uncharacterized protein n=1 Tax=Komagataella phaffii (strain GS115 / ATCC 20864) TaxID=644223 RepID=C4QYW4_KOMPG|nr:Hypothetical protein PAS_chr1-4_0581 [Komagataella phaffii GS115]CAY68438.1 Hypothetical protein PAS_chr1-4_0581 [Komagataella phaffii GS115]